LIKRGDVCLPVMQLSEAIDAEIMNLRAELEKKP